MARFVAFVRDDSIFDAAQGTFVAFISDGNIFTPGTGGFLGFIRDGWVFDSSGSPAVLAYYTTDGLSNARTEAINGLMKKAQRIGHGFRNLRNYRLRLLLHCGGVTWQDQPAARLRKRIPRNPA